MYGDTASTVALLSIIWIPLLIIVGVYLTSMYLLFSRFYGENGWLGIIPIFNMYIIAEKTFGKGRGLLFLLTLIPYVGFVYSFYFAFKMGKSLGLSDGMSILFVFFQPFVILGISFSDQYEYIGTQNHIFLDK